MRQSAVVDLFEDFYFEVFDAEKDLPTYLLPFGDIHWDSPKCSMDRWRVWCDWARNKKRAVFIGMGDYFDSISTHERRVFFNPDLHEDTIENLEVFYRKQVQKFAKEIEFMRGRLVGLIEGNHHIRFADSTTSTQMLCSLLGCKYLGVMAAGRIAFKKIRGFPPRSSYHVDVVAHHGVGAARTLGMSLNKVGEMSRWWEADIFLMGHDHQKVAGETEKLRLKYSHVKNDVKPSARKVLTCRTGTFLKGYVPGKSSYAAGKAMPSTTLGTAKIEMTPRRIYHKVCLSHSGKNVPALGYDTVDESYIDLHVSI